MPNNYFQFKQFKIEQEKCAMKVCTDSCILGAYAHYPAPRRILDIGTGTGLLTLMLAQRYNALIDAVEIDEFAVAQAGANIQNSLWSERIRLHNKSIQEFRTNSGLKYDLIISNPPFFAGHLKSPHEDKNKALHNDLLSFEDLSIACSTLLSDDGVFFILLPPYEAGKFKETAAKVDLFPKSRLDVFSSEEKGLFRVIYSYALNAKFTGSDKLIIKTQSNEYTAEFKSLLQHYYLNF